MAQLFKDAARSVLASSITSGSTSLVLLAGTGALFPVATMGTGTSGDWFKVVLQSSSGAIEIVRVRTRGSGSDVLADVLRGQDGTTAQSFPAGTVVGLRLTAADIAGIADAVPAAVDAGLARFASLKNKVINCNFACNSRRVSGSVVLAANAFGHDMWFGGASGCTYSVTGIIATITAGALKTVVDGSRIHVTGNHTLSWAGTAQARINGGSLVSSPATTSLTAGSNVSLEWATGTVSEVQLEEGDVASTWQPPDPALQRVAANHYCQSCIAVVGSSASNYLTSSFGASSAILTRDFGPMRASPNLSAINGTGIEYFSFGSAWVASTLTYSIGGYSAGGFRLFVTLSADGDGRGKLIRRTAAGDAVVIMSAEQTA